MKIEDFNKVAKCRTQHCGQIWVRLSLVLVLLLSALLTPEVGYAGIPSGVPITYAPCPQPTATPDGVGNTIPENVAAWLGDSLSRMPHLIQALLGAIPLVLGEAVQLLTGGENLIDLAQEMWPEIVKTLLIMGAIMLFLILFPGAAPAVTFIGTLFDAMGLPDLWDTVKTKLGDAVTALTAGAREAWFSDGTGSSLAGASQNLAKGFAVVLVAVVLGFITYADKSPGGLNKILKGKFGQNAGPEKCDRISKLLRIGCFVAGTPVLMADGSFKPIEQVKYGEWVLSKDESSGKVEARQVTATSVRQHVLTMVLRFEDGSTLETTEEHPLYADGKGFAKAGEVGIGTAIATRAGPGLLITEVKRDVRATTVYNFTVEDFHTYFVGKTGLWVHNAYLYDRVTWRIGFLNQLWNRSIDAYGRVRCAVTGRYVSRDNMVVGHKYGWEFRKHVASAARRGIDRQTFIDEEHILDHYQVEAPNLSHAHEAPPEVDYWRDNFG